MASAVAPAIAPPGSNQDSPDPESAPRGQRSGSSSARKRSPSPFLWSAGVSCCSHPRGPSTSPRSSRSRGDGIGSQREPVLKQPWRTKMFRQYPTARPACRRSTAGSRSRPTRLRASSATNPKRWSGASTPTLGKVRHRSEVVEYRVVQHFEQIGERLKKLGIVTGNVTGASAAADIETPRGHGSVSGAGISDPWAWVELNYRPHAYQAT